MRGLEAAALAAAAFFALRALRRRLRPPEHTMLLQVRAPGRAAPRDATQRTVINADAMAWMQAQTGPFSGSVVTGIPDISEVSLPPDEYRKFFLEAVELILRRTPTDGVAVFCQTDCRIMAPPSADSALTLARKERRWRRRRTCGARISSTPRNRCGNQAPDLGFTKQLLCHEQASVHAPVSGPPLPRAWRRVLLAEVQRPSPRRARRIRNRHPHECPRAGHHGALHR